MAKLVGISGSLRAKSFNTALLNAAVESMPEGSTLAAHTIRGIPLYDGDVEKAEGLPAAVEALKDAIAACDGLLLVTPEYNNSIPGVLKNAIDWLSRPDDDIPRVFGGKPVAVIGASPSSFGTTLSQVGWLPVLRTLGTDLWTGQKLFASRAHTLVDGDGVLADPKTKERLRGYLAGFIAFAEARRKR